MLNAHETITTYFDALVQRDAETLISMMHPAGYYVKIGTDTGEIVEGPAEITAYYRNHVASTEDFSITVISLDVQERNEMAWFYTQQTWQLKWQGTAEEFLMRMTGVLEKVDDTWKFVQIHASIGVPTS